MKVANLVISLLERERYAKNGLKRKFDEFLEYKTAASSTLHLNYNLQEATRSTFVIAFSPDGTKIATSHGNHTVKISDCFTCKVIFTLKGHPRTPWCVLFHPKINSILASGCLGGQVRLWDLNKITDDNVVFQSQAVISSISFHPTDDILAISTHNKIIFYDWNAQQTIKTLQMKHNSETVRLVRFLPDGSKLITAVANVTSHHRKKMERLNVSSKGDAGRHNLKTTTSCMHLHQQPTEVKAYQSSSQEGKINQRCLKDKIILSPYENDNTVVQFSLNSQKEENTSKTKDNNLDERSGKVCAFNHCNNNSGEHINNCNEIENKKLKQNNNLCSTQGHTSSSTTSLYEFAKVERDEMSLNRKLCINFHLQSDSTELNTPAGKSTETGCKPSSADSRHSNDVANSSDRGLHSSVQEASGHCERNPSVSTSYIHGTNTGSHTRSEFWNFTLGGTVNAEQVSTLENLNDLGISIESASSTIPVQGHLTFPFSNIDQSTGITNLLGVQTAIATATAQSSHHVHTAVVIASQENENSEMTLQRAVNRAIAGAFAGSGEGAVANNIIDTSHRLQLWDSSEEECPDVQNGNKNVIVPLCKIHNDSSIAVSQDGSCIAVFVPNEHGFPMDAQIQVISLKSDTFLHCMYSRKFGPNAVSVSLSPLNNFLMIGLASHKLHWQPSANQLVGQILQLPSCSNVNYEDKMKPVLSILHKCNQNQNQRSNISVNTLLFHPSPGMGILYGTNRGHVQHCHIAPDHDLVERRQRNLSGSVTM